MKSFLLLSLILCSQVYGTDILESEEFPLEEQVDENPILPNGYIYKSGAVENSDDFASKESNLIDYIEGPIPRLHDVISVASGSWVESAAHMSDACGVHPYQLGISFSPQGKKTYSITRGWDFLHPKEIRLVYGDAKQVRKYVNLDEYDLEVNLTSYEAGGSRVLFKAPKAGADFFSNMGRSGFTHFSSINSPKVCAPYNTRVKWNRTYERISMRFADGTHRVYKQTKAFDHAHQTVYLKKKYFKIHSITFPTGFKRVFSYTNNNLSSIETYTENGTLIGRVQFQLEAVEVDGKRQKKVILSNGKSLLCNIKKFKNGIYSIRSLSIPGHKSSTYDYKPILGLFKKRQSDGRIIEADFHKYHRPYYDPFNDEYFYERPPLANNGKVKSVKTTYLPGQTEPLLSYRLEYKEPEYNFLETCVRAADGTRISYFIHQEDNRIHNILKRDKEGKLLSSEYFKWSDSGELIQRALLDGTFSPILIKTWKYDVKGNVTHEKIRGYFTEARSDQNKMKIKFSLQKNVKWISGGELLEKKASYDTWNRKTSETDAAGYRTEYRYRFENHSPDLAGVYRINPQGAIFKRSFYRYGEGDFSRICVEEIHDDGSSYEADSFNEVTVQTSTCKSFWNKIPYWGALISQEEFIWTPSFGKKRLKKVHFIRDPDTGLVIEEKMFDSDDVEYAKTSFSYDELHRCNETTFLDGSKKSITFEPHTGRIASQTTTEGTEYYTYDHNDKLICTKMVYPDGSTLEKHIQRDITGRVVTEIDARGREKKTTRDLLDRILEVQDPAIIVDGKSIRPTTKYRYSGFDVTVTMPNGTEEKRVLSSHGKPFTITTINGTKTHYKYDLLGREIEKREEGGICVSKRYDDYGNVIESNESYDATTLITLQRQYRRSQLIQETGIGTEVTFSYNSNGLLEKSESRDLVTDGFMRSIFSYDSQHRKIATIFPENGTQERLIYDSMDRIIEKRIETLDGNILSSAKSLYDSRNRLIETKVLIGTDQKDPSSWASTYYEYGPYNALSKTSLPDGRVIFQENTPQKIHEDGFCYTLERVTAPDGIVTEVWKNGFDTAIYTYTYNSLYQLIRKKQVFLDSIGNIAAIEETPIHPETSEVLGAPIRVEYSYDASGNIVREIRGAGSLTPFEIGYKYDAFSRKIEEQKPSGVIIFYSYDKKGRLASQRSSDGSIDYQFTYNELDLPIEASDSIHKETIHRTYTGRKAILEEKFSDGLIFKYGYDSIGRCIDISSLPFGKVEYGYQDGSLKTILYKEHRATYTSRSPIGIPLSYILGELQVSSEHDTSLRMRNKTAALKKKGWISHYEEKLFSEDRIDFSLKGQVTHTRFSLPQEKKARDETYQYDSLGQMRSDSHYEYGFDSLNRSYMLRGEKRFFNALHQLQSEKRVYDADGRVISDKEGRKYSYDALDRLIRIEKDGSAVEYGYDAFHRRLLRREIKNSVETTSERFLFQGDNEIGSYTSNYELLSFRVLGESLGAEIGGTLLIVDRSQQVHYAISDISGHIRALWNPASKETSEWIDYSAFNMLSRSETSLSPWNFSSKREEPFAGLIFFGRRFYDPQEASWMSMDPMGLGDGPNFYAYVHNNPYMSIDLYGLWDRPTYENDCRMDHTAERRALHDGLREAKERTEFFRSQRERILSDAGLIDTRPDCKENFGEAFHWRSGNVVDPDSNTSGTYFKPRDATIESREDFLKKNKDTKLNGKLISFVNGINTSLKTVLDRADIAMKNNPDILGVIINYNSTEGVIKDLMESVCQAWGSPTEVVRTLHEEYTELLSDCRHHGLEFELDVHVHSQGGLIYKHIMDYENEYVDFFTKKIYTYGSAYTIPNATNFIAMGDLVPFLNTINYNLQEARRYQDMVVLPFRFQSPLDAHGFDNPSYQEAFLSVL